MEVERINLMCALLGISQSKLARDLGITKQKLNHIINGNRKIDVLTKDAILKYFNISEQVFFKESILLNLIGNELEIVE